MGLQQAAGWKAAAKELTPGSVPKDDHMLRLLAHLKEQGYQFTVVTPATHAIVLARELERRPTLRDIFGWNRKFSEQDVDPEMFRLLADAELLKPAEGRFRSALRVASLGPDLFFHSAYPTDDEDAVFFGPDTYRFAEFVRKHMGPRSPSQIVDMGSGSGAGGIFAARLKPSASITLVDTNPAALDLARVNARAAGVAAELWQASSLPQPSDMILANPPYMIDQGKRAYRDGGDLFGGEISLEWARDGLDKLTAGGTMLLYTGVAYVDGEAPLVHEIEELCRRAGSVLTIEEIDPDVFGDELAEPQYREVERIAAMGFVIRRPE